MLDPRAAAANMQFACKARGIEDKNPRTGVASGRGKNPLLRECLRLHYAKLRNNPHARTTFPNYLLCSDLRVGPRRPCSDLRISGFVHRMVKNTVAVRRNFLAPRGMKYRFGRAGGKKTKTGKTPCAGCKMSLTSHGCCIRLKIPRASSGIFRRLHHPPCRVLHPAQGDKQKKQSLSSTTRSTSSMTRISSSATRNPSSMT